MSAKSIQGLGQIDIGNGTLTDVGLSIMQIGMVTGLHAAISPSFFTFACFAKKPEECAIARKTLWISLAATSFVNVGIFLAFKRLAPAIIGQIVGTGLFIGGLIAVSSAESAPTRPSMEPQPEPLPENITGFSRVNGLGRVDPVNQPEMLRVGAEWHHYLDQERRERLVQAGRTEGDW